MAASHPHSNQQRLTAQTVNLTRQGAATSGTEGRAGGVGIWGEGAALSSGGGGGDAWRPVVERRPASTLPLPARPAPAAALDVVRDALTLKGDT